MNDTEEPKDEAIFDLSKKKKKKKPKEETNSAEKESTENAAPDATENVTKEKKSKAVAFAAEQSENRENSKAEAAPPAEDEDEDDVLGRKKKRKGKSRTGAATGNETEKKENEEVEKVGETVVGQESGQNELTYEDLLNRAFNLIREANPSGGNSTDRIKLILKPPQVARVGTKRTSFLNFGEICKSLKRQDRHLFQYFLAELGTNGSIDQNAALLIKGRFQQKQLESVLRSYIKEYVICKTCRSADTSLQKEERMTFLSCNTCQSRYSVTGIKTGFQAQVGKRAANRAKTA